MWVLESEITVGDFRFSGVHEVTIKKSMYSLSEVAEIKLPARARVWQEGKAEPTLVVAAHQFAEGDAVTIRLGYNGALRTEFAGFVKQILPGTPMTIACEGYSWLLRRNRCGPVMGETDIVKLLTLAVGGLEDGRQIEVKGSPDLQIEGLRTEGMNGLEVIEAIRKATDNNVTCFFVAPDVLWCGLLQEYADTGQTPITERATYQVSMNMLPDHKLAVHKQSGRTGIVYAKLKNKTDGYVHGTAGTATLGKTPVVVLQQMDSRYNLTRLAREKIAAGNYKGYEGHFTAFLEPYVVPGMVVTLMDDNQMIIPGDYLAESVTVRYGKDGARREIAPGRKIS